MGEELKEELDAAFGSCEEGDSDVERSTWMNRAAEDGDKIAQYLMGVECRERFFGFGDMNEAKQWFQKSADQRYSKAVDALAEILAAEATGGDEGGDADAEVEETEPEVYASDDDLGKTDNEAEDEEEEGQTAEAEVEAEAEPEPELNGEEGGLPAQVKDMIEAANATQKTAETRVAAAEEILRGHEEELEYWKNELEGREQSELMKKYDDAETALNDAYKTQEKAVTVLEDVSTLIIGYKKTYNSSGAVVTKGRNGHYHCGREFIKAKSFTKYDRVVLMSTAKEIDAAKSALNAALDEKQRSVSFFSGPDAAAEAKANDAQDRYDKVKTGRAGRISFGPGWDNDYKILFDDDGSESKQYIKADRIEVLARSPHFVLLLNIAGLQLPSLLLGPTT